MMNFIEAVKTGFNKYATFSGRASRSEFWFFTLFCFIATSILGCISSSLQGIFTLAVLIPSWAVTFRRLHDTGKSGWLIASLCVPTGALFGISVAELERYDYAQVLLGLLSEPDVVFDVLGDKSIWLVLPLLALGATGIYYLIVLCKDSDAGANKYGANPKENSFGVCRTAANSTAYNTNTQIQSQTVSSTMTGQNSANCQHCGANIGINAKFCPKCGHEIIKIHKCPNCGTEVSSVDAFCKICGTPLKSKQ